MEGATTCHTPYAVDGTVGVVMPPKTDPATCLWACGIVLTCASACVSLCRDWCVVGINSTAPFCKVASPRDARYKVLTTEGPASLLQRWGYTHVPADAVGT